MLKLPTILFLISLSLLAVIHTVALNLFLYWRFSWFDIPMHFFGGAIVALGIFTLKDLGIYITDRHIRLVQVLVLVFMVALSWEAYELFIGVPVEDNYAIDTITDLCLGVVGGLVGYSVGTSISKL